MEEFPYTKMATAYSHMALLNIFVININKYILPDPFKIIPALSLLEEHLNGSSYLDVQSCTGVQELF